MLAQYRDIGLLKALGMTPGQVTLVFLIEHVLLALIGGLLGLASALALSPIFLHKITVALNTTATASVAPGPAALLLGGVLGLVAVFTLLPALRGGRVSAITAITQGFAPARTRPAWLARLALALRLPTPVVFGAKDVFAQRGCAVMTISALTLTIVTLVFALSTESTIRNLLKHPELEGEPFDLTLESQPAERGRHRAVAGEQLGHPLLLLACILRGCARRRAQAIGFLRADAGRQLASHGVRHPRGPYVLRAG